MSFGYDEERPAGFQDADFEMRELEESASRVARRAATAYLAVRTTTRANPYAEVEPYLYDGAILGGNANGLVVKHFGKDGFGPVPQCDRLRSGLMGCTIHDTEQGAWDALA